MSEFTIEKLRAIQRFIPWDEWPSELNKCSNCISYALGLPVPDTTKNTFGTILICKDPAHKLEQFMQELGIIATKQDKLPAKGKMAILMYSYYYEETILERDYEGLTHASTKTFQEVHLVRIEPDGTWTHKYGWEDKPSVTSHKEIYDTTLSEDGVILEGPTAIFLLESR